MQKSFLQSTLIVPIPLWLTSSNTWDQPSLSNLSLDVEINARIGKAITVMVKLNKRVWQNISLTMNTRLKVYRACVTSILLYGSETWTPYARQEAKLNSLHLHCLKRILGYHLAGQNSNHDCAGEGQMPKQICST